MENFARIIDTNLGQVLILIEDNDAEKTEIKFYFKCRGLGVSKVSATMHDNSEESFLSAKRVMEDATVDSVTEIILGILEKLNLTKESK